MASFLALAAVVVPSFAQADEGHALAPTADGVTAEPASSEEGATEWNSPALAVTGSILSGVGVAAVATGAALFASDPCADSVDGHKYCGMGFGQVFGGIAMIGGAGLVLIGSPMIVAGAWQVPSDDRGIPPTTAELRVGASRAELAVTF